ncbi:MAG: hypothetical protein SCALA702_24060 [Melioribacteraceae bacterium]|nr:MAG: hypothetical protein SCALA702_24060 [Melioribacteraceae bacterium]
MINLKVIFLFLALYSFISAQWVDVSPEITAPAINDISYFLTENYAERVLIAGDDGTCFIGYPGYNFIHTEVVNLETDADIFSIEVYEEQYVWLGGRNFLARSTDTAQTFSEISLPQEFNIRGLNFISPQIGYFYTYDGLFAQSADGGINWQIDTLSNDSLHAFQLLDNGNMIIVGAKGQIYISPQSDVSWREIDAGIDGCINDVEIAVDGVGYLCTKKGYKTTDYGESWVLEALVPESDIGYIEVAYQSFNGIAAFYKASHECVRLNNTSIQTETIPALGEIYGANYYPECNIQFMVFGSNMFVAGGQNSTSYHQLSFGDNGPFRDCQIFNADTGFVFGSQSFYTINGGQSWEELPSKNSIYEEYQGHFFNLDEGLLLINSLLYKTYDRGLNWTNIGTFGNIVYLYFYNDNMGYIASDTEVYISTDKGETWESKPYQNLISSGIMPSDMFFISDSVGFIFSHQFGVVRTTDAGQNWNFELFHQGQTTNHTIINSSSAMVTGVEWNGMSSFHAFGMITEDSGENWTQTFNFTNVYCRDLEIDPTGFGLLARSDKKLMETMNGGYSWNEIEYPFFDEIDELVPDSNGGMYAFDYTNKKVYQNKDIGFITVGLEEEQTQDVSALHNFTIYQNYPNPFNPETTIRFYNPVANSVLVTVYNMLGERVSQPLNKVLEAGEHSIKFNGENLPSGIYFYRIQAGKNIETRKMILIK